MRTLFNLRLDQANVRTLSDLYDTVYADLNLGRPLPATYDSDDHKNLKYIYEFYNTAIFDGNFGRVMATPSLRILRSKLANIVSNSRLRLSFVFGHHSNLLPLLTALNLTSTQCLTERWKGQTVSSLNCASPPAYAANLIVELHGDGNAEYSVRVKYNGEYLNLCESKSTQCPYNDFVSRLQAA